MTNKQRSGRSFPDSRGFLMSLEAAASLLLVMVALSALPLFSARAGREGDFFLCSDAAVALAKSSAFSSAAALHEEVEQAASISGMCLSAESGAISSSSCSQPPAQTEAYAFSFPVWSGREMGSATVSCWKMQWAQ